MSDHPIEGLVKTAMDNLKEMVDVDTIIGDPVETKDGTMIIPVSKVCIGFASGGSEFNKRDRNTEEKQKYPFGGGTGAGMTIQPVAFLVINQEQVRLLPVTQSNSVERVIDAVPGLIDEVTTMIKNKFCGKKKTENECCQQNEQNEDCEINQ